MATRDMRPSEFGGMPGILPPLGRPLTESEVAMRLRSADPSPDPVTGAVEGEFDNELERARPVEPVYVPNPDAYRDPINIEDRKPSTDPNIW